MINITKALVEFQGEADNLVGNVRNHRSKLYAGLDYLTATLTPMLYKHGLALLIIPGECRDGVFHARVTLIHESGESIDLGVTSIPLNNIKGNRPSDDAAGAYTTARRLIYMGIAGIAQTETGEQTMHGHLRTQQRDNEENESCAQAIVDVKKCTTVEELKVKIKLYDNGAPEEQGGWSPDGRLRLTKIFTARKKEIEQQQNG